MGVLDALWVEAEWFEKLMIVECVKWIMKAICEFQEVLEGNWDGANYAVA